MVRSLFVLLTVWGLSTACRRPADNDQPGRPSRHFVVVTHGQAADPFWSVVKRGVEDAARDLTARVDYRAPESFDMVRMARLLDGAVASRPDGIALTLPDPDALAEPIRTALAAGIPIVSFNSGQTAHERLGIPLHVGQDEYEAGRRAGMRFKDAGISRALCINHEVGNAALDRRCEGFQHGLGGGVRVIAVDLDPTKTESRILAVLDDDSEAKAILTLGPLSTGPVLAALDRLERDEDIVVATFDLSEFVLTQLEIGRIDFALDQQQYLQGYLPLVLLAKHLETGAFPSADILTGPGFVTRDGVATVRDFIRRGVR